MPAEARRNAGLVAIRRSNSVGAGEVVALPTERGCPPCNQRPDVRRLAIRVPSGTGSAGSDSRPHIFTSQSLRLPPCPRSRYPPLAIVFGATPSDCTWRQFADAVAQARCRGARGSGCLRQRSGRGPLALPSDCHARTTVDKASSVGPAGTCDDVLGAALRRELQMPVPPEQICFRRRSAVPAVTGDRRARRARRRASTEERPQIFRRGTSDWCGILQGQSITRIASTSNRSDASSARRVHSHRRRANAGFNARRIGATSSLSVPRVPSQGVPGASVFAADRSVGQGQQMQREAFRACQFAEVSVVAPAYEVNVVSNLTQLDRQKQTRTDAHAHSSAGVNRMTTRCALHWPHHARPAIDPISEPAMNDAASEEERAPARPTPPRPRWAERVTCPSPIVVGSGQREMESHRRAWDSRTGRPCRQRPILSVTTARISTFTL